MIVVTGAAGHVGANLLPALLAQGRPVRVLSHKDQNAFQSLEVEVVPGDICNLDSLIEAFKGAEVVYHLAAYISISEDEWPLLELVNVTGTRNVVEACRRCGVRRLIHFSTIHSIARPGGDAPVDESAPLVDSRRYPLYDRSKAAAEREVLKGVEQGLDVVIISPTGIIGPNDYRPSHFGDALLRMANGRLPSLVGGGFDWVDVRDVVQGALRAEEKAPAGAKYILSGHWVSVREIARMVEQVTGVPAPGFVCPLWLASAGAPFITTFDRLTGKRPLYTSSSLHSLRSNGDISHRRATEELGYSPRPFSETLTDTLRWFEKNGLLTHPLKITSAGSA